MLWSQTGWRFAICPLATVRVDISNAALLSVEMAEYAYVSVCICLRVKCNCRPSGYFVVKLRLLQLLPQHFRTYIKIWYKKNNFYKIYSFLHMCGYVCMCVRVHVCNKLRKCSMKKIKRIHLSKCIVNGWRSEQLPNGVLCLLLLLLSSQAFSTKAKCNNKVRQHFFFALPSHVFKNC